MVALHGTGERRCRPGDGVPASRARSWAEGSPGALLLGVDSAPQTLCPLSILAVGHWHGLPSKFTVSIPLFCSCAMWPSIFSPRTHRHDGKGDMSDLGEAEETCSFLPPPTKSDVADAASARSRSESALPWKVATGVQALLLLLALFLRIQDKLAPTYESGFDTDLRECCSVWANEGGGAHADRTCQTGDPDAKEAVPGRHHRE